MTNKYFTDTRITGLLYLGLAITGMFSFLYAKSNIFVDGDALSTTANLLSKTNLARTGIALELLLVIFQSLSSLWFYKIFHKIHNFSAGLIAVFGNINAIMILVSSSFWLEALTAAINKVDPTMVYVIFSLHEFIWIVSGLFFGLWLIPMGYSAWLSKMPRVMGGFLMIGGIGYILSTFSFILLPEQKTLFNLLSMPATIGEFWMIGYLLTGRQEQS